MTNSLSLKIALAAVGVAIAGGAAYYLIAAPKEPLEPGEERMMAGVDAMAELAVYGSAYGSVEAKVRYAFSSTGPDGSTEEGEMTQYWMPEGERWRVDSEFDGVTGIVIHDAGDTYSCVPSEAQCFSLGSDASGEVSAFTDPMVVREEVEDVEETATVTMSQRTIAERDATCFLVSDEAGGSSTMCFDTSTQVMLLMEATSEGSSYRMEALEVSTDVSVSDFLPPYPITDIGAMMGGFELPEGLALPEDMDNPEGVEIPEGFMMP